MDEEVTIVRVYLKESDYGKRKRLIKELYELLRAQGLPGETVFRGILGFGPHGAAEADILHLAGSLPLVIEFFALPDKAKTAITAIREREPDLNIVHWTARAWAGTT
jgi:uncharacterized protein